MNFVFPAQVTSLRHVSLLQTGLRQFASWHVPRAPRRGGGRGRVECTLGEGTQKMFENHRFMMWWSTFILACY